RSGPRFGGPCTRASPRAGLSSASPVSRPSSGHSKIEVIGRDASEGGFGGKRNGSPHAESRHKCDGHRRSSMSTTKIDVFPHIMPRKFFDRMLAIAPRGLTLQKRMSGIPVLVDVEERFRIMDRYDGYVQVLTLSNPPLEVIGGPDATPDLARLANDEMAALVVKHPDRFPAFVASLPMNNPDAALKEIDRAIGDLGATGVQMFSNVNRR